MDRKYLAISFLAILASFAGGFFAANALNRSELNSLRTEVDHLNSASAAKLEPDNDASISDDELHAKIVEADKNPTNFDYQKNLGTALYQYASMKRDDSLLKESIRILDRASKLKADDVDVMVALGNAHFDIGYFSKIPAEMVASRKFYDEALAVRPNDVEIRTDLGLTYFLADPPDDAKAIEEFQRSLKADPKHTKTLEFMIQSLVRQNKVADAERYLEQLKAADPSNETIAGLEAKVAQAKTAPSK
ncbi:MAG: tetratricopeptide repeat protein [Acidobacteriota bacterium]